MTTKDQIAFNMIHMKLSLWLFNLSGLVAHKSERL